MPIAITGMAVFAADQFSKWLVLTRMTPGEEVPVIPGAFHITSSRNPGAAFGILQGQTFFFLAITVLLLAGIVFYARRLGSASPLLRLGLGLAAGGAAGNLVDRLRFGTVVDFLDFGVWPVFNLADVAIVAGAFLLGFHLWRDAPQPGGGRDGGRA